MISNIGVRYNSCFSFRGHFRLKSKFELYKLTFNFTAKPIVIDNDEFIEDKGGWNFDVGYCKQGFLTTYMGVQGYACCPKEILDCEDH